MKSKLFRIISFALVLIFVFSVCSCTPSFVEELGDIDDESTTVIITYDTQGGKMPSGIKSSKSYPLNKIITSSPKPTKDGYTFIGWFVDDEEAIFPYKLKKSVTLTAKWEEIIEQAAVSLKLNGGTLPEGESEVTKYDTGSKITSLPTPQKENFEFLGWFLAGEKVEAPYTVTCDVILVAKWEQILTDSDLDTDTDTETDTDTDIDTDTEIKETVDITLELNGGALPEGEEVIKSYEVGSSITSLPTPQADGFEFIGWYIDDTPVSLPYEVTEAKTISAKWQEIKKIEVTLDVNGGEMPEGTSDSFNVIVGNAIGTLPKPTRFGYDFIGWFEDGDSSKEVDKKTIAGENDLSLVALWEPLGELVAVEFSLAEDEILNSDTMFFEMVKGDRISDYLSAMPTASRFGYRFIGWQTNDGSTVTITSIITEDTVLSPVWEQLYLCLDGTENHQWNAWQETGEATCTSPSQQERMCNLCGHVEFDLIAEALGHDFGAWKTSIGETIGDVSRARSCTRCGETQTEPLDNITFESFNVPTVSGDCWGADEAASLIDGDFTDQNITGKGTGAITVVLTAKSATYVDVFTVTGYGSASYTVSVTYSDGTQKALGIGSFGSTKAFTIEAEVVQFTILMETPSNGSDFWSELATFVINE